MPKIRARYRLLTIALIILLSLTAGMFFAVAVKQTSRSYETAARDTLITAKRSFLHDIINNQILDIDRLRSSYFNYYGDLLVSTEKVLIDYYANAPHSFITKTSDLLSSQAYSDIFRLMIFDSTGSGLVFANHTDLKYHTAEAAKTAIMANAQNSDDFILGDYQIIIWTCNEAIDAKVQAEAAKHIHSYNFDNDVYIWVNEVVDYNGGENYAIRRIHPNLKETEGMYGHEAGDKVLKHFTAVVQGNIRSSDIFFRWGGEEFLLICTALLPENAVSFGTKLLGVVADSKIDIGPEAEPVQISFSAGAAYFNSSDITYDDAMRRADKALFYAKNNGRSMVCRHTGDNNEDSYTCEKLTAKS